MAITRAKRELFLTMSHEGYRGGITTFCRLSRFLDDPQVLKFLEVSGQEQLLIERPEEGPSMQREELIQRILGEGG